MLHGQESKRGGSSECDGGVFPVVPDIVLEEGLYHYFITKEEEKALWSREKQERRKATRAKE